MPSLYELAVAAGARALPAPADCEALLAGYLADGRLRAPGVALDDAAFVAHVVARLSDDDAGLSRLHGGDLFLAAALERGDPAALAAFERDIAPDVLASLARMAGVDASEALQALRVHLFVGDRPRIADYRGHGMLRAWVRISATRMAWRSASRRELGFDAAVLDAWPASGGELAGRHLRADLRAHLERAVASALATLSPRARVLLRQHVLDSLTIDELAGLHRVHRATCARWLADARDQLARRARQALRDELRLPAAELASVLRAIDSQLDLSLSRLLRATESV